MGVWFRDMPDEFILPRRLAPISSSPLDSG